MEQKGVHGLSGLMGHRRQEDICRKLVRICWRELDSDVLAVYAFGVVRPVPVSTEELNVFCFTGNECVLFRHIGSGSGVSGIHCERDFLGRLY